MWLHDIDDGCPSCSFAVDNMPNPVHLNKGADTTLALVSRAPFERIELFRSRMSWTLPWYSSYGSDFNYDFHVSNDETIAPAEYNYKDKATLERKGWATTRPATPMGRASACSCATATRCSTPTLPTA